jgi:hypothetical protein
MALRAWALWGAALFAASGCTDTNVRQDGGSQRPDGGSAPEGGSALDAAAELSTMNDASLSRDAAVANDGGSQPIADGSPERADAAEGPSDAAQEPGDAAEQPGDAAQESGPCTPNPCVHATGCSAGASDFTCSCEQGWFDKTCSTHCDDNDATTTDSLHAVYGCAHRKGDFTTFDTGLYADHTTGLGWWPLVGFYGYGDTKTACAELVVSGRDDFRLPTIDDVRSLAADCPATRPGGSCPISDPSCLSEDCGFGTEGECASCIGGPEGTAQHPTGGYCRVDAPLCNNFWTSSVCSDCSGEQVWFYGVGNGNFYHNEPTNGRPGACVAQLSDL